MISGRSLFSDFPEPRSNAAPPDNSIWGPCCASKDPYDRRPYIIPLVSTCRPLSLFRARPGLEQGTGPNEVIEGNHADREVTGHHDQPGRFRIGCNIVLGLVGGRTMCNGGGDEIAPRDGGQRLSGTRCPVKMPGRGGDVARFETDNRPGVKGIPVSVVKRSGILRSIPCGGIRVPPSI